MNKKGISPIIATAILVGIVVTLAVIVWIFISSFVGELIVKQNQPAETICIDKVKISADVDLSKDKNKIVIVNNGGVPLAGFSVEMRGVVNGRTQAKRMPYDCALDIGASSAKCHEFNKAFPNDFNALWSSCQKVKIIPTILGTGDRSGTNKLFSCEIASVESVC